jgi:hypothetical protein
MQTIGGEMDWNALLMLDRNTYLIHNYYTAKYNYINNLTFIYWKYWIIIFEPWILPIYEYSEVASTESCYKANSHI